MVVKVISQFQWKNQSMEKLCANQPRSLCSLCISFYWDLFIFVGYTIQLAGSRFPDQELNPSPWLWKCRVLLNCHKFPHFVFFLKMCVFRWEVSTVRTVSFFNKIWSQCCKFPDKDWRYSVNCLDIRSAWFGHHVCVIPDALGVCNFWDCL